MKRPLMFKPFLHRLQMLEVCIPYLGSEDDPESFMVFRFGGYGEYSRPPRGPHYVLKNRPPEDLVPVIEIDTCLEHLDSGTQGPHQRLADSFWEIEDHPNQSDGRKPPGSEPTSHNQRVVLKRPPVSSADITRYDPHYGVRSGSGPR